MTGDLLGQQLGSYRIEGRLGSGAMGVVYRATHVKTGNPAAVKVVLSEYLGRGNAGERFEREAEILQQIRHPNIVRFLAVGRSKGTPYFAMEFIDGRTLDVIMAEREIIPWTEVVDLGAQVCEALQYAHERGVVHRDLKPSNLMVTSEGRLKLTDFGIAKDLDATALTATGRTLGTAAYMAPEQIRGTPEVSHKTDLYSLGCVLYQLLVGSTPFRGSNAAVLMNAHLSMPPPRPSEKNPQIPRALDDLVVKLMAKSPVDRPWDAQAVLTSLQEIQDKLRTGEPIKMAFGPPFVSQNATQVTTALDAVGADSLSLVPTREAPATSKPALPSFEATSGSPLAPSRKRARKKKQKRDTDRKPLSLGTLGLAAGLLGLVALITFLMWPESAEQLYAKAQPLMNSATPTDWDDADRRYLKELDRRFPDHPYKDEVKALRDKIALNRARNRGERIVRGLFVPDGDTEELFVRVAKLASEAVEQQREHVALVHWQELAAQLKRENRAEARGWLLLAQSNAREMEAVLARRRREASALLSDAKALEARGESELATQSLRRLIEEFRDFPYVADIVALARAALPDSESADEPSDSPVDSPL